MARKTHFETLQEIEPLLEELRKEQKLEPVRWWKDVSIDDQAVVFFWEDNEPPTMTDVCDVTEWCAEDIEHWGLCSPKEVEDIQRLKLPEVSEY